MKWIPGKCVFDDKGHSISLHTPEILNFTTNTVNRQIHKMPHPLNLCAFQRVKLKLFLLGLRKKGVQQRREQKMKREEKAIPGRRPKKVCGILLDLKKLDPSHLTCTDESQPWWPDTPLNHPVVCRANAIDSRLQDIKTTLTPSSLLEQPFYNLIFFLAIIGPRPTPPSCPDGCRGVKVGLERDRTWRKRK